MGNMLDAQIFDVVNIILHMLGLDVECISNRFPVDAYTINIVRIEQLFVRALYRLYIYIYI